MQSWIVNGLAEWRSEWIAQRTLCRIHSGSELASQSAPARSRDRETLRRVGVILTELLPLYVLWGNAMDDHDDSRSWSTSLVQPAGQTCKPRQPPHIILDEDAVCMIFLLYRPTCFSCLTTHAQAQAHLLHGPRVRPHAGQAAPSQG
jgi:hypothetical protein